VDSLEERYPSYDGLNLTFETREGILKHCSRRNAERITAREPGGIAQRFLPKPGVWLQPSLEAQLTNLADEIAYNAHDIDDGVRSGLVSLEQLQSVDLFAQFCAEALKQHPHLGGRRLLFEAIRRMLSAQVYDVMAASRIALLAANPQTADDVRRSAALVCFSPEMAARSAALKQFLSLNLYRHPQVMRTTQAAKLVVHDLFNIYLDDPLQMPPAYAERLSVEQGSDLNLRLPRPHRVVADYIAGMTDRFAHREHDRLCVKSAALLSR
jgi:dGTPase